MKTALSYENERLYFVLKSKKWFQKCFPSLLQSADFWYRSRCRVLSNVFLSRPAVSSIFSALPSGGMSVPTTSGCVPWCRLCVCAVAELGASLSHAFGCRLRESSAVIWVCLCLSNGCQLASMRAKESHISLIVYSARTPISNPPRPRVDCIVHSQPVPRITNKHARTLCCCCCCCAVGSSG